VSLCSFCVCEILAQRKRDHRSNKAHSMCLCRSGGDTGDGERLWHICQAPSCVVGVLRRGHSTTCNYNSPSSFVFAVVYRDVRTALARVA
jgi:hypothetical protein